MLEKELKLDLLNEENYSRILNFCGKHFEIKEQTNLFFDTDEFHLRKLKLSLRLRQENDLYLITVKGKNQSDGELAIREELETFISKDEFDKFINNNIVLSSCDFPPCKYLREKLKIDSTQLMFNNILSFKNKRTVFILENNNKTLKLEFDKTEFANEEFAFELEVEFEDVGSFEENKDFIAKILKENNIVWKVSPKSKFKRALDLKYGYNL